MLPAAKYLLHDKVETGSLGCGRAFAMRFRGNNFREIVARVVQTIRMVDSQAVDHSFVHQSEDQRMRLAPKTAGFSDAEIAASSLISKNRR